MSCESGAGVMSCMSKSPQRSAMKSSVESISSGSNEVTSFRRVCLKSGSPLK